MRLTRRNINSHRQLRRRFASGTVVGPAWTVLASDVMVAACHLSDVDPRDILLRMHSRHLWPELRKGEVFAKLSRQLPNCSYIRLRSGVLQAYCGGAGVSIGYCEDQAAPTLMLFGMELPESVLAAASGRRLSEFVDLSRLPALGHLDPVMRKVSKKFDPAGYDDLRIDVALQVEWRTVELMPGEAGLRFDLMQDDPLELPSDRAGSGL